MTPVYFGLSLEALIILVICIKELQFIVLQALKVLSPITEVFYDHH